VTAVIAVMSTFSKKNCKLRSAVLGNEKTSRKKAERANFPEENTGGSRSPSQISKKGRIPKKLASKSKKLELNCTNLKLIAKRIETAKTGEVTAVVAAMSIFKKTRCKLQSANLGNERPSCQKAE
jgi:hypothetical protein